MAEPSEEGDFLQAIECYTEAIALNRNNHLLFSNRSAAFSFMGKFREALDDAKRCHELKPDWPMVYPYIKIMVDSKLLIHSTKH